MPRYDAEQGTLVFGPGERLSRRTLLALAVGTAGSVAIGLSTGSALASGRPAAGVRSASFQETPKQGGQLRIGYVEPPSLDPQFHANSLAGNIVGMIYDGLLIQDPNTSDYIAGPLTDSFEVSEDSKSWTFHLKQGITFHDGSTLEAADIKAIYEYAVDPKNATFVTGIYLPPNPTFDAPDPQTFVISSPLPYGPLASHIAWDSFMGVFPPEARTKYGADFGRNPVGSGPFKFKEWAAGDHLTLTRNDAYAWGPAFLQNKGPVHLDELYFKFTNEQSTIVNGLQSGELDLAFLPNQFYDQFANNPDYQILTRPSGRLDCLGWNNAHWPFDDLKTRQALTYGFDKQRILQVMEGGHGKVMYGMIVPALPHYWEGEQDAGAKFNLDTAKSMLADAGWADSDGDGVIEKDGKPFSSTLIVGGSEAEVRWSSLIQAQAKDLGIDVKIQTLELAAWNAALTSGDFDMYYFIYDTVDPDIIWFFFHSAQIPKEGGSGLNWGRVNDPHLDDLIIAQRNTVGADRDGAVQAMVQYMMDQAYVLPLYAPDKNTVFTSKVKGVIYYPNAMDWELTDAWIDQ
ncbi:MAG TPA: ABC transporter substrate-binding protein [Thermomicrobiales bacterium]|jgi:peptide/nickel transport system substrate-binding protein